MKKASFALAMSLMLLLSICMLAGCRVGAGEECLTDSDCKEGLVCVKRDMTVEGKIYIEKWGNCKEDSDADGVPDDGDLSGSSVDNLCGVHAFLHPATGEETVVQQSLANMGKCDDNCIDIKNDKTLTEFGCLAQDDCCPISESEKDKTDGWERCEELTDAQDTCAACLSGSVATPRRCFLTFVGGPHIDENGCIQCRPMIDPVACPDSDFCKNNPALPTAACSGYWTCEKATNTCKFVPRLFNDMDKDGYNQTYQLDQDGDGLGDKCDNCVNKANGFECGNPAFSHRCDVNGDGILTESEKAKGAQADGDGDDVGDACDLCPLITSSDNDDPDGDGLGNPCDKDDDGDGICDPGETDFNCEGEDNCPIDSNANQEDLDGDGIGDVCDVDRDGDGILDDGSGNGLDGDTPCNPETGPCCLEPPCNPNVKCRDCDDNCPLDWNEKQLDNDNDSVGNACDPDADSDGLCSPAMQADADNPCTGSDNCPFVANPLQEDQDNDGVGDDCDICPTRSNPRPPCTSHVQCENSGDLCNRAAGECFGQLDSDGDGLGDPCDPNP